MVLPDGRVALLDFGITARFSPLKQNAFLRLIVGASMNDIRGQLAALRDLGALPPDTDLDVVIVELGLDGPPVDPTTLSPDEMVGEIQRLVKALLGYGARLPKELMLYIKNLVFLDGAIANLAPDLDLFAEIATISEYMATRHGERIAASIGMDANAMAFDFSGIKASFGVDPTETSSLTYRDLQQRRELIRSRLAGRKVL
jgi:ubiquinone biosynthesis protein